jgi:hypothetical protein
MLSQHLQHQASQPPTLGCMLLYVVHAQGHTTCSSDELIRPESTEQLAAAIKDLRARAQQQGRPLKMRATRPQFATMHSMPCAQQPTLLSPFEVQGKKPITVG